MKIFWIIVLSYCAVVLCKDEKKDSANNSTDENVNFPSKPEDSSKYTPPSISDRVVETVGPPRPKPAYPPPREDYEYVQPPRRPIYDTTSDGYNSGYGYVPTDGYYDAYWSPRLSGSYRPHESNRRRGGYYNPGPRWSVPAPPDAAGYPVSGGYRRGYENGYVNPSPGYGYPDYIYGNRGIPPSPSGGGGGGYGGYVRPSNGYGVVGPSYGF